MNTQELRLGNYVLHNGKRCIITAIDYDEVQVDNQGTYMRLSIEDIEPIPLTNELMEQLEFVRIGYNILRRFKDPIVEAELTTFNQIQRISADASDDTLIIHCEHLHKLQNAYYAITGEELEVKFE